jgi:hypothetical protein
MSTQSEIKWSSSAIDPNLRLKTLRYISKLDVRIRFTYLLRENIPHGYHNKNGLESGFLYTHIIGELLEMYLPTDENQILIFCDRRHLKRVSESEFRQVLETRLLTQMEAQSMVQVKMVDSTTNVNIQIVDWIAGALAWYLEDRPLGEECFKILKNNILGKGKEIFQ